VSTTPIVSIENVTFAYDGAPVLVDVNVTIARGDFACIIGPNAGGKSTLLKLMLGILSPTEGTVRLFGAPPREGRQRVGYLPQQTELDPQFPITVLDVVLMGRLSHGPRLGPYRRRDRALARRALDDVGLPDLGPRPFRALSGGQRQRVLIARALACEPEVLMLDEPASSLDVTAEKQLYDLLAELNRRLTIVLVSHNVAFVSTFVKTAICVNRTVHTHSTEQLSGEVIEQLYGQQVRLLHHGEHAHVHAPRHREGSRE